MLPTKTNHKPAAFRICSFIVIPGKQKIPNFPGIQSIISCVLGYTLPSLDLHTSKLNLQLP